MRTWTPAPLRYISPSGATASGAWKGTCKSNCVETKQLRDAGLDMQHEGRGSILQDRVIDPGLHMEGAVEPVLPDELEPDTARVLPVQVVEARLPTITEPWLPGESLAQFLVDREIRLPL